MIFHGLKDGKAILPSFFEIPAVFACIFAKKAWICQNDEPHICSNLQIKKKIIFIGEKVHFLVENRLSI